MITNHGDGTIREVMNYTYMLFLKELLWGSMLVSVLLFNLKKNIGKLISFSPHLTFRTQSPRHLLPPGGRVHHL